MRKVGIVAAALLLMPAVSQAASLDELLAERGVVAKSEHGGQGGAGGKLWYDDGTRFDFPDAGFTAKVNTVIRTRWEYTDDDSADDETSRFSVNNARLYVQGTALNKVFNFTKFF